MSLIKAGTQDWGIDSGPVPFRVTGVSFWGVMPGGHSSASFSVPVPNAYITQHHTMREGVWITIWDDGYELFEGEILSIKPSVQGGTHSLAVECGGMMAVADFRKDVAQEWIHRGTDGWRRWPGTPSGLGSISFDNGVVDLRVPVGSTEDFSWSRLGNSMSAFFPLGDLVTDDEISRFGWDVTWDVTNEAGGQLWEWHTWYSNTIQPSVNNAHHISDSGSESSYTDIGAGQGIKCLMLTLNCGTGNHTVTSEKYVSMKPYVYSSGRTTNPRISDAMVQLAGKLTGVSFASTNLDVGPPLVDLHVGDPASRVSVAGGLQALADLHAQPFQWGFGDNKTFFCRPQLVNPDNDAHVIVVGGGRPGLVSWDCANYDEDVPDFCCVIFGNKDDGTLPEGFPRRVFRPTTPADFNTKVETLDYSGTIMSDAAAAALGDNLVGRSPATIPGDYVFRFHPDRAQKGLWPGVNGGDATTTVQELSVNRATGTLDNFPLGLGSGHGWEGTNSPADPTCLSFGGATACLNFGNLAQLNLGSGARTFTAWYRPGTLGAYETIFSKMLNGGLLTGWTLYQNSSNTFHFEVVNNYGTGARRGVNSTYSAVVGTWVFLAGIYDGNECWIYVNGYDNSPSRDGSSGSYNADTTAYAALGLRDPSGSPAYPAVGSVGECMAYPRALTAAEVLQIYNAGQCMYQRSAMKGTVTLQGPVQNRKGALIPAHHVRSGWWIQHTELSTKPLYISGHSVDLATETNALTIGEDWMEAQIGVKEANLLALPDTTAADQAAMDAAQQAETQAWQDAQDAAAQAAADALDAATQAESEWSLRHLGYDATLTSSYNPASGQWEWDAAKQAANDAANAAQDAADAAAAAADAAAATDRDRGAWSAATPGVNPTRPKKPKKPKK